MKPELKIKNTKWKRQTHQYSNGSNYYLGMFAVGSVFYDGGVSSSDENKHKAVILLPGIGIKVTHYKEEEKAKEVVEKAVKIWIDKSGLKEK